MTSLRHLAGKISELADQLDKYKESTSMDAATPQAWLQRLPNDLGQSRLDLIDVLQEMKREVQGAESALEDLLFGYTDMASLQTIYTLDLPHHIPLGESASYSSIAQSCGIEEITLRRIFRYAISNQIFTEPEPGQVAHTDISKLLLTNPDAFDALGMALQELLPACHQLHVALKQYPRSAEPTQTAYNIAKKTDLPMYLFLGENPDRARRFGAAMRYFTSGDHIDLKHLLEAFPWDTYDQHDKVMIDVGGGQGAVTTYIASATKHMRFIVQDFAQTIDVGKAMLPTKLISRVEFMAHNFFEEQPVKGADVYFFRWVMHNWSDKYCLKILRAIVPALKQGAKVLLYEHMLEDTSDTRWSSKPGRYLDIVMLSCSNGCVRTESDWKRLFQQADGRFVFEGITRTSGSLMSLIEFTWVTNER